MQNYALRGWASGKRSGSPSEHSYVVPMTLTNCSLTAGSAHRVVARFDRGCGGRDGEGRRGEGGGGREGVKHRRATGTSSELASPSPPPLRRGGEGQVGRGAMLTIDPIVTTLSLLGSLPVALRILAYV